MSYRAITGTSLENFQRVNRLDVDIQFLVAMNAKIENRVALLLKDFLTYTDLTKGSL